MIVVDTSVWIAHFKKADATLVELLLHARAVLHPWVLGEVMLGGVPPLGSALMEGLPRSKIAHDAEILEVIEGHGLDGTGIGYVDAGLLCSTLMTPDADLWTFDKRLHDAAANLGIAFVP